LTLESKKTAMGKIWVLDTETKGTGANMVPLEKVERKPRREPRRPRSRQGDERAAPGGDKRATESSARRSSPRDARRVVSPLPPGHVRKKATGEIGRVRSVDAKAGTASVRWLRRGATSTVPLSSISRR
jgi:hypothetical protein